MTGDEGAQAIHQNDLLNALGKAAADPDQMNYSNASTLRRKRGKGGINYSPLYRNILFSLSQGPWAIDSLMKTIEEAFEKNRRRAERIMLGVQNLTKHWPFKFCGKYPASYGMPLGKDVCKLTYNGCLVGQDEKTGCRTLYFAQVHFPDIPVYSLGTPRPQIKAWLTYKYTVNSPEFRAMHRSMQMYGVDQNEFLFDSIRYVVIRAFDKDSRYKVIDPEESEEYARSTVAGLQYFSTALEHIAPAENEQEEIERKQPRSPQMNLNLLSDNRDNELTATEERRDRQC